MKSSSAFFVRFETVFNSFTKLVTRDSLRLKAREGKKRFERFVNGTLI